MRLHRSRPRRPAPRSRRTAAVATGVVAALIGAELALGPALAGAAVLPVIAPGAATIVEGDEGTTTVEIPVTLSVASDVEVTADWSTLFGPGLTPPSPATPGTDFTATSGTVTFAPGDTTETIAIDVHGDTDLEPDDYIVAGLSDPTNATLGGYYGLGFAIIDDDDTPPTIVPGAVTILEGNTGSSTAEIPVTLTAATTDPVTVDWSTLFGPGISPPSPATPGTDFTATTGTVTFAPGDTTETIAIEIAGDITPEPDDYIVAGFTNPTNATLGGYYGLGFAIIDDDDTPPTIVPGSARADEGDEGATVLAVPVTLSSAYGGTVTVDWETFTLGLGDGGPPEAEAGVDYVAASGTVTFAPAQTSRTMEIIVNGDVDFEPDEAILIELSAPTGGVLGPSPIQRVAIATVRNDDPPPPARTLTIEPSPPAAGGDTVVLRGANWTPGAEIGFCQAIDDLSLIDMPGAGCFAGTGSPGFVDADEDGSFAAEVDVHRWGYIGTLDLFVDCTDADPGCLLGAAELADFAGTVTVTPLPLAAPPPPPDQRGELTATPATSLDDGAAVELTGTGFRPGAVIDLHQCIVVPVFTGPAGCEWGTRQRTSADGSGAFVATFTVGQLAQGQDCAARTCYLVASEAVDFVGTYVATPIGFAPPP